MGLQAGGRRRAAVPSGAARLLRPEYVALPAERGGGDSTFSSPRRSPSHLAGAGGRIQERPGALVGWNLSLAAASSLPALQGHPLRTRCPSVSPRGAATRLGAKGHALANAHAQSGERPPRLQLPEETAAGRGSRAAGAILKSDPRATSLCVSSRVLARVRRTPLLKGRTLGTRRLAGEAAGGDMAGCERGLRCCHSASP